MIRSSSQELFAAQCEWGRLQGCTNAAAIDACEAPHPILRLTRSAMSVNGVGCDIIVVTSTSTSRKGSAPADTSGHNVRLMFEYEYLQHKRKLRKEFDKSEKESGVLQVVENKRRLPRENITPITNYKQHRYFPRRTRDRHVQADRSALQT